jgi:PAS domain-containing protein
MLSPEIADIVETLRENEQYSRIVADSAPDVVVSIHEQGTTVFAGKVAGTVLRYSVVLLNAESQEVTAFG